MRRIALFLLTVAACKPQTEAPRPTGGAAPRKPKVTVAQVGTRKIHYKIEAVGSIEAAEEISIAARVPGVLDEVCFKEGDSVDPSKVLARIDLERYALQEQRARAEFDRAKAQAELAQTLYNNRLQLYEQGKKQNKNWVTEEQMKTWEVDLKKADAEVARARAELELAQRNLRDAEVRPPVPGVINRKLVSKGEYVRPETVIATMLNLSTLHVRFTVTEKEASRLKGKPAISCRPPEGEPFRAELFYVSQKADPTTRAVECKALVTGKPELRAGIYVKVTIVTEERESVVIPERAVIPSEKGFLVYVLEGTRVKAQGVDLGLRTEHGVEVTDRLAPGKTIVVDGAAGLRDGMEVEIHVAR